MTTLAAQAKNTGNAAQVRVPVLGAAPDLRFTVDGDAALEHHLARTCERLGKGIQGLVPAAKLEGILLGGGYGRGEGGVLRTAQGDQPYNDLEFYVCIRGNRHWNERQYGRALHTLGEILTPQAGVEVEFRITSLQELQDASISMFSYDLVSGHRWVIGADALLANCAHHRQGELIPLGEATRLMMNRCSGLLFATERLQRATFTPADADFVARNVAKAQLAAGDAVLTAYGEYHWSVQERQRRLGRLARLEEAPWLNDVCHHHGTGVEFKLHPRHTTATREQLSGLLAHVSDFCREVWLWLEGRRLRRGFRSVAEYADVQVKCPDGRRMRTILVNAKVLGFGALFAGNTLRHPRERILTALPLLLWQTAAITSGKTHVLARVQHELRTEASSFSGLVSAYQEIWSRVN